MNEYDALDLPRPPGHMSCPNCGAVMDEFDVDFDGDDPEVLYYDDTCPACGHELEGVAE